VPTPDAPTPLSPDLPTSPPEPTDHHPAVATILRTAAQVGAHLFTDDAVAIVAALDHDWHLNTQQRRYAAQIAALRDAADAAPHDLIAEYLRGRIAALIRDADAADLNNTATPAPHHGQHRAT
jgi:hypothetical protein